MITIRHSGNRGHANHGWLDTWHTFSFGDYFDAQHMQFRSLRVINDDTIAGGGGFGTHPHRDMEIITYVIHGTLRHRDSMGNESVLRAEDVQRISAGTGIEHSEFNDSADEPVRLLQIWILPERKGLKPGYGEKSFRDAPTGVLTLVASKPGRDGSLVVHQDVELFLAKLEAGGSLRHELRPLRHAWVQVAEGNVTVNGHALRTGDGAAVSEEQELRIDASGPSRLLVFDLG